jgi:hypothetical protein
MHLSMEKVDVHGGHNVLMEIDDTSELIVGAPQEMLGSQIRPCQIHILIFIIFVTIYIQFCCNSKDNFCIDVTFEMRTVLSRIRLFNDTILNVRHHFILNRKGGEESRIAERQREREYV